VNAPVALTHRGELAAVRRRAMQTRRHRLRAERRERRGPTRISLWLPLTPLFAALAPFVMLLAPLMLLAPPMWRVNPYLAAFTVGRVLLSLGGTDIDVDAHDARIRIRIF
jgi:hypothetical protein